MRRYVLDPCRKEKQAVKRARKNLRVYREAVFMERSIISAFNLVNGMFGYPENVIWDKEADRMLEILEECLAKVEKALAEKQKEGRRTKAYKDVSSFVVT